MGAIILIIVALTTAGGWRIDSLPEWSPYLVMIVFGLFALFTRVIAKIIFAGLAIGLVLGLLPITLDDITRALGF